MAVVVEGACAQQFQHFISNSPWQHEPVVEQIARDVDDTVGGKPDSCLLIDETSFVKQGNQSVGVARQWCGRLGKVDNCQVAVFAVLADGQQQAPVDVRLYLPKKWIDDPQRCDQAGVPASARQLKSKTEHALDMVRAARARCCALGGLGPMAATGRSRRFCGRWMMPTKLLWSTSIAPRVFGSKIQNRPSRRSRPVGTAEERSSRPPWPR